MHEACLVADGEEERQSAEVGETLQGVREYCFVQKPTDLSGKIVGITVGHGSVICEVYVISQLSGRCL